MGRLIAGLSGWRRVVAFGAVVIMAGGIAAGYGGAAGAAPQPTVSQVRAEVNSLQAKADRLGEQYDQAGQELAAARGRLAGVQRETGREQARYSAARAGLVQAAAAAYEDPSLTSTAGLLTSADPAAALGQASVLMQLAGTRNAQAVRLLADARRLAGVLQEQQRTEYGIAQLRADGHPGGEGGRLRLRAARQAVRVGRHRPRIL